MDATLLFLAHVFLIVWIGILIAAFLGGVAYIVAGAIRSVRHERRERRWPLGGRS